MDDVDSQDERCDLCGQVFQEDDLPDGWLGVEVYRDEDDYLHADFCSQEHAAEWFRRPLPPPEANTPVPATLGDRLFAIGCATLLGIVCVTSMIGTWTAVQAVGRWVGF